MPELQQAGTFRGEIVDYDLFEADSGAKAIVIHAKVHDVWCPGEDGQLAWFDWREHDLTTKGNIWVIKKDGNVNESQVRALMDHAGWGANFGDVVLKQWQPKPIQFVVTEDEYRGEAQFRISWLNAYDGIPGGGNVSPDKAKQFDSQYGAQLRALSGNASRSKQKPGGSPAKGPTKPQPPKPTAEEVDDVSPL